MADVLVGPGSLPRFLEKVAALRGRAVVIAGTTSFGASGAEEAFSDLVTTGKVKVVTVRGPLPTLGEIAEVTEGVKADHPSALIAVGGGVVIDSMKLIALLMTTKGPPSGLLAASFEALERRVPMAAVPTTAGSGSERTPFAVVYDQGIKYSVEHRSLLPDWIVLDPALPLSMSPQVAASSGLDAMAHAVESLWAVRSTEESRETAIGALEAIWHNILDSTWTGSTLSRSAMLSAASLAGEAIAATRTTVAHALSYHLTSRYGVPHGHAVALTLGEALLSNSRVDEATVVDPRGPEHVRRMVDLVCETIEAASPQDACSRIRRLIVDLGLEGSVVEVGVRGEERLRGWVSEVDVHRLGNNPTALGEEELLDIVRAC